MLTLHQTYPAPILNLPAEIQSRFLSWQNNDHQYLNAINQCVLGTEAELLVIERLCVSQDNNDFNKHFTSMLLEMAQELKSCVRQKEYSAIDSLAMFIELSHPAEFSLDASTYRALKEIIDTDLIAIDNSTDCVMDIYYETDQSTDRLAVHVLVCWKLAETAEDLL